MTHQEPSSEITFLPAMREMSADEGVEITQEKELQKLLRLQKLPHRTTVQVEPEGYLRFTEAQKTDFHAICNKERT